MRASTLAVELVSAAALLSFTSVGFASQDGVWHRLLGLVGKEHHEDSAVHQRDQDAYTNPYGYQPPRPTSSTSSKSLSTGKHKSFMITELMCV